MPMANDVATSAGSRTMPGAMSIAAMPRWCIAKMPAPVVVAAIARRRRGSSGALATVSATAQTAVAAHHESSVSPGASPMAIGSENASMPKKCIDQMPVPRTTDPPNHQRRASVRLPLCMRLARSRATNEAKTAMAIERTTTIGSKWEA